MSVKMKQSGIEWIGEIPEHWDLVKGKYLFTNIKEIVGKDSYRFKRLALTLNGIIERDKESSDGLQPINFDTYQIVRENNLIFKLIDLQNISTSRVGLTWSDGIMSSAYIRLVPVKNISIKFYENFYLMMWYYNIFNNLGDAGVRSNLNATDLLNIQIPYPPIEEQRLIAVQLNQICGTLDNTKADIEKQIEVLNEYKKSLITESVTKGLDKNVELKDSGVFYVQPFNKNWELVKLGYICTALERVFHPEDTALICSNKGKVLIRPEEMRGAMMSTDSTMHGIHKGDIAIHGMDTWHGAIAVSDYDGKITKVVHVCKSEQDHRFIVYYLQQLAFNGVYKYISNGVRGNTSDFRSWNKVADIYITLPPIEEQKEIADYLDSKCSEIDSIIETKKQQLELLEEYKKSIIYEYVTGKREVSAPIDEVTAPIDEVSAKPDFAVAQNTQSVSIELAGDSHNE